MSTILSLIGLVLKLFGFGKPDPVKQGEQLQQGKDAEALVDDLARGHAPVTDAVKQQSYRD